MKKFIVTTTINKPTKALQLFDNMDDWHLIVIGDKKTPEDFSLKNGTYIPETQQRSLGFDCVNHIPWNVIQRRNIGYLFALREGADIIATVDDDNIPKANWGKSLPGKSMDLDLMHADLVYDPLYDNEKFLNADPLYSYGKDFKLKLWHRGFPVQLLEKRAESARIKPQDDVFVDVVAELWDGDPDVDAICRIAHGPFDLKLENNKSAHFAVALGTFSPFNTQNTFFTRKIAPCMCLPYDIGRMDDIWASYMTEKVMHHLKSHVAYLGPTVYQDRNEHDLTRDLEKEMIGYRNTLQFLNRLKQIELSGSDVISLYSQVVSGIEDLPFISKDMIAFQRAWIDDVGAML